VGAAGGGMGHWFCIFLAFQFLFGFLPDGVCPTVNKTFIYLGLLLTYIWYLVDT